MFSQQIDAEGAVVFEKACKMNLVGIVSKRVGSPYWSGRGKELGEGQEPDV
jgi:ATP-dependent DNA ligase